ncbi:restriction endonuclease [Pseudoalteromonas phenolica]|uniref:restriction endonuclease n=1 Tax=Pseudoalteromonas phenolica TaxID=161398 RepID=UPI00110BD244|nr:restriction endonuclease [Pseudoalteromonas phenolica]TMN87008.1 restriction endonuclease [Pseudoalteromonas phenolica]
MTLNTLEIATTKVQNISSSNLSIYDHIDIGDSKLWLTSEELSAILNKKLVGYSFEGLALRTRSKVAKEIVCEALGYPLPSSFKKVQPRFTGQQFDTYVQKSNNLQVWNEELDVERRYVLIRINQNSIITKVKVVTGSDLVVLDTTGKLTQKYQAKYSGTVEEALLLSKSDTDNLQAIVSEGNLDLSNYSPTNSPQKSQLLSIEQLYASLKNIVGKEFDAPEADQERKRGDLLHSLVCKALGYKEFNDHGTFPDVKHQLLEVKLQTSPTIDLGLICPDSESKLDINKIEQTQIRHCDVRYAIFYGSIENKKVVISNFYIVTGTKFFEHFSRFEGKVLNKKIQIPLPTNFFND